MMSAIRLLFPNSRGIALYDDARTKNLPLFGHSGLAANEVGHIQPSLGTPWTCKAAKLRLIGKLFLWAFAFAFALITGHWIARAATLSYHAALQNIAAHHHSTCNTEIPVGVFKPLAAPPVKSRPVQARVLDRKNWKLECSSSLDEAHDCKNVIKGDNSRMFWRSKSISSGTHSIEIDLDQTSIVHSLAMKPSVDWEIDEGSVKGHRIEIAIDKKKGWELVALGTWRDSNDEEKFATFEPRPAKFVRLTILTTANKKFVDIRDINIYAVAAAQPFVENGGRWNITLNFPLVPVTAFLDPTSNYLITLASFQPDDFAQNNRQTYSSTWDPVGQVINDTLISDTGHDMFCPGTSFDQHGRVIFTGGSSPLAFSIYDSEKRTWSHPKGKTLRKARGYQGQTSLSDGRTFIIGGTWSGNDNVGNRDGEIYDPKTQDWTLLSNVSANAIKMDVRQSCNPPRQDGPCLKDEWRQHHPWLFAWKNNSIFHAGPSRKMNWIDPTPPTGSVSHGGYRADGDTGFADGDAVCGITSMYDAERGLILTAGGAPNYHYWFNGDEIGPTFPHRQEATNNAFEIDLGRVKVGDIVKPKQLSSMTHKRIFANAVVLPNGETFVVGGQIQGEPFHDETWLPTPEIYSPVSNEWREMARHSIPRVYHSWALLLPDATVLVGGGGLSAAHSATNHYDAQIYQPAYLFTPDGKDAVRPKIIRTDKKQYTIGNTITITADVEIDDASLIRYSAATHALNNDMRRIKLTPTRVPNTADKKYAVTIPGNAGVALPGYWMLFVSLKGVPSTALAVKILAA